MKSFLEYLLEENIIKKYRQRIKTKDKKNPVEFFSPDANVTTRVASKAKDIGIPNTGTYTT